MEASIPKGQSIDDANVFQSSQPPPEHYRLTNVDSSFLGRLTPPPSQQYGKRARAQVSDAESEPDFDNSPSKNKGKKKAHTASDDLVSFINLCKQQYAELIAMWV